LVVRPPGHDSAPQIDSVQEAVLGPADLPLKAATPRFPDPDTPTMP